jgi:putative membrane protein
MRYVKVLAVVIIFFLCMIFFVQNTGVLSTELKLSFKLFGANWMSSPIPVYLYILLAFVIGVLVSMAYFLLEKLRQGRELRKKQQQINNLEKELSTLRNLPLETQEPSDTTTQSSF